MAALVVGRALPLGRRDHDVALGAQHDPLERLGEVARLNPLVAAARGRERGLVDQVARGRRPPCRAWTGRSASTSTSSARGTSRRCTRRIAARPSRSGGLTVTRRSKRPGRSSAGIEDLRPVGGRQDDDALGAAEAVHLGEDLVERLLALVVAAQRGRSAARAPDGVELVDEDDRRGGGLGLGEQVAHAAGADAHDHLDELRGREREEGHVGLARDGPGEQRLAGAGGPRQQHAARDPAAEAQVAVGVLQEVDDLDQLLLGLVDAGHVLEGHPGGRGVVALGLRAPEVREGPGGAAGAGARGTRTAARAG